MTSVNLALALAVARDLAARGGALAVEMERLALSRDEKPDGSFVTEADHAVEALIRAGIHAAFPDHDILGEEAGLQAAGGGPARGDAPLWIVDPIDGTHNYMHGIPIWGTMVALSIGGRNVVGAVSLPALGELYDAASGLGARCNGRPIAARSSSLDRAFVVTACDRDSDQHGLFGLQRAIETSAWRVRGFGDVFGHMLVARGAVNAMVELHDGLKLHDVAALVPIIEESGGRITDLEGRPWEPGHPIVAAPDPLHSVLLDLARATVAPEHR